MRAARRSPGACIEVSDLSADALALARENRTLFGLDERIAFFQGDLYEPLAERRYDLIVCNPPYVNSDSMRALPAEFRAEPQSALDGGADGMDLVRPILSGAVGHLRPGGLLLLEIGHEARFFEAAFPDLEFSYLPTAAGEELLVLVSREQLQAALKRTRTPAHKPGPR